MSASSTLNKTRRKKAYWRGVYDGFRRRVKYRDYLNEKLKALYLLGYDHGYGGKEPKPQKRKPTPPPRSPKGPGRSYNQGGIQRRPHRSW